MCIAVPAKIDFINGDEAIVNYDGVKMSVNITFINEPTIGDYVLIHAGCAIQKIDKYYAIETLKIFKELSEVIKEC